MAYTLTRLQITTRARRKADAVNDANIEEAMLNDECNDLVSEAHKIVLSEDADRFTASTTISAVSGTFVYTLPADFQGLRRLDKVDGTTRTMIEPSTMLELDMDSSSGYGGETRYRLVGGGQTGSTERLHLRPDPGTFTYELWYVTAAPTLSADGSTYDCRFDEHRYVIAGLAAFIAERQDRDATPFRAEQARAETHIRAMAKRRDHSRARQITDVRSQRWDWRPRYPRP